MPRNISAHADTRTEITVGSFESCRSVDAIAVRRVMQPLRRADVADDGRAGVDTDPRDAQRDAALGPMRLAKRLAVPVPRQRTPYGAARVVVLIQRRAKNTATPSPTMRSTVPPYSNAMRSMPSR